MYLSSSDDDADMPPLRFSSISPLPLNENPSNGNILNGVNGNNVQEAGGSTRVNVQLVNPAVAEDTENDTASTISNHLQFAHPERNEELMNERQRNLDERERLLKERETANINQMTTTKAQAEEIKRKIDRFLEDDFNANLLVDPIICGYAFSAHAFLYMTKIDQIRLCKLRLKIAELQEKIDERRQQNHANVRQPSAFGDPTCVVCFDDIRSPDKRFSTLRCGHIYCTECMERITRCGVCRMEFDNMDENDHIRLNLSFN